MEASLYTQCERRLFEQFIFFRMFPEYPLKDGVCPQSILPDWHSFELCSFVTAGGLEKKVLISPALNGDLAFPIMSTSDLENKAIPLCLLVNRYDCREWDNLRINLLTLKSRSWRYREDMKTASWGRKGNDIIWWPRLLKESQRKHSISLGGERAQPLETNRP